MKFILAIACLLFNSFLISAPISVEKAEIVAANVYAERSNTGKTDGFRVSSIDILDAESINLVYIFQLSPNGFVMVSGDDRVQPLLAYSFESRLIMDNMPTNLEWMLNAYKQMVIDIRNLQDSPTEQISSQWTKYLYGQNLNIRNRNMRGPLFESHWDQSGGWNNYGPPADQSCEGDQAPSGCVAVSMSSIMHYWQYPTTGQGDNSCYCGGYGT